MSDLRARILNADDVRSEDVEVPEWGVTVRVQGMTGAERARYLQATVGEDGKPNFDRIYPEVLIACAYDPETGEKVFEAADRDALNGKAAGATERIAKVAMRLSGIADDARAEAKNA